MVSKDYQTKSAYTQADLHQAFLKMCCVKGADVKEFLISLCCKCEELVAARVLVTENVTVPLGPSLPTSYLGFCRESNVPVDVRS
jgi:hypothetical protein